MKMLTQLYSSNATVTKFIRGNQVSGMSQALSSLDAFLGTKMDQKSDNSGDYVIVIAYQSNVGKNTEVI